MGTLESTGKVIFQEFSRKKSQQARGEAIQSSAPTVEGKVVFELILKFPFLSWFSVFLAAALQGVQAVDW
jgi:hypothetical protein